MAEKKRVAVDLDGVLIKSLVDGGKIEIKPEAEEFLVLLSQVAIVILVTHAPESRVKKFRSEARTLTKYISDYVFYDPEDRPKNPHIVNADIIVDDHGDPFHAKENSYHLIDVPSYFQGPDKDYGYVEGWAVATIDRIKQIIG